MPGQISIRLNDNIIRDLNRLAKKRKTPRAEIIRTCLVAGLEQMITPERDDVSATIVAARDEILKSIGALAQEIRDRPSDDRREKDDNSTPSPKKQQEGRRQVVDSPLVATDKRQTVEDTPRDKSHHEGLSVQGKNENRPVPALDLYLNQHGEMVEGNREQKRGPRIQNEQRTGNRLRRIREAKGWPLETLAATLNISSELMMQIESGRQDIPHSRAIRVEAKLQQWETELIHEGSNDDNRVG